MDIHADFYQMFPNIPDHEFRRLMRSEFPPQKLVEIWAAPAGQHQSVFHAANSVNKGKATLLATIKDGVLTKINDFVPGPPLPAKPAQEQASHLDTKYWQDFVERALWLGANRISVKVLQSDTPKGQKEALETCSRGYYLTNDPASYWTITRIIDDINKNYGGGSYELIARHKDCMFPIFSDPMDVRVLEIGDRPNDLK